jgi:hypothetical protein
MILHRGCAPQPELENYNSCYGNFNGLFGGSAKNYNSCYENSDDLIESVIPAVFRVLRRNNFATDPVAPASQVGGPGRLPIPLG